MCQTGHNSGKAGRLSLLRGIPQFTCPHHLSDALPSQPTTSTLTPFRPHVLCHEDRTGRGGQRPACRTRDAGRRKMYAQQCSERGGPAAISAHPQLIQSCFLTNTAGGGVHGGRQRGCCCCPSVAATAQQRSRQNLARPSALRTLLCVGYLRAPLLLPSAVYARLRLLGQTCWSGGKDLGKRWVKIVGFLSQVFSFLLTLCIECQGSYSRHIFHLFNIIVFPK